MTPPHFPGKRPNTFTTLQVSATQERPLHCEICKYCTNQRVVESQNATERLWPGACANKGEREEVKEGGRKRRIEEVVERGLGVEGRRWWWEGRGVTATTGVSPAWGGPSHADLCLLHSKTLTVMNRKGLFMHIKCYLLSHSQLYPQRIEKEERKKKTGYSQRLWAAIRTMWTRMQRLLQWTGVNLSIATNYMTWFYGALAHLAFKMLHCSLPWFFFSFRAGLELFDSNGVPTWKRAVVGAHK